LIKGTKAQCLAKKTSQKNTNNVYYEQNNREQLGNYGTMETNLVFKFFEISIFILEGMKTKPLSN